MYNYEEAVKNDVLDYIKNEIDFQDYETIDDLSDYLVETLWADDSVTGNGSGSYTFSRYEAEENLCHNMDLVADALAEFGEGVEALENGAEFLDVTIRCYLLGGAISEALEEIRADFEEAHNETEEEVAI